MGLKVNGAWTLAHDDDDDNNDYDDDDDDDDDDNCLTKKTCFAGSVSPTTSTTDRETQNLAHLVTCIGLGREKESSVCQQTRWLLQGGLTDLSEAKQTVVQCFYSLIESPHNTVT
ncbi:hypothetical protein ElyMa_001974400 [Elysia marginata]|uniref:Uncharacterized protein n=1 Tax=Elysia marginata TaxID=1093978 RepID=A0AAV4F0N2_9GAST|nr:hypothetical protein ElyMa_001974400 [Elysia marginata]